MSPSLPIDFRDLLRTLSPSSSSAHPPLTLEQLESALDLGHDPNDKEDISAWGKRLLEERFLSPVRSLQGEGVGLWQVVPEISLPTPPPTLAPAPPTHHLIPLLHGVDGTFSNWKETYAPAPAPSAQASSSLMRQPGGVSSGPGAGAGTGGGGMGMTFVRGRGGYMPFRPGGLDDAYDQVDGFDPAEDDDDENEDEADSSLNTLSAPKSTYKTLAPGFKRGINFNDDTLKARGLKSADEYLRELLGEEIEGAVEAAKKKEVRRGRRRRGREEEGEEVDEGVGEASRQVAKVNGSTSKSTTTTTTSNIDDLLPISRLPAPPISAYKRKKPKREWAHVVDINQGFPEFHELVPEMAHKYPFELDTFQKRAVYHLENGESVFVAAHTSAGKTVVAEYAISLAMGHMTRAIYTSPIKALSNQKFRDFKMTFGAENVGILTGDVQINAEASCLIMTTEILRSMLYRGADLIRDLEFVVFDEVHYVNDAERGVVWEEVIIMLPEHVGIILLSATVPNTMEFASWVGRTKKKDIYVISTPKRPVPLKHYIWANKELHTIVDEQSRFIGEGYKAAGDSLRRKQEKEREAAGLPPLQRTGGRGMAPARGGAVNGRGGPPGRGGRGGAPAPAQRGRGGGNVGTVSYGAKPFGGAGFDKNIWVNLIQYLKKNDLLPVVVFTFSKKRCEENANSLSSQDLCNASEKSEVHVTVEKALTRLKGSDKRLPQILRMRELLGRGIGVHHGGLLPIVKEVVELLFQRGLVKVLFATETFAMGVNMPAKSVVFSGIRKHDGHSFRTLHPGEYTQMAGRAGRRGLDTTGTVIIVGGDELPEQQILKDMMLGTPNKLISQFRLTYNMILNLLRVEALRVEEMIKRSFSENASQSLAPEQQRQVAETEKRLALLPHIDCNVCDTDISPFYDISAEVVRLNIDLLQAAARHPQGSKLFSGGRIVTLYDRHFAGNLGVILRSAPALVDPDTDKVILNEGLRCYWVLAMVTPATKNGAQDLETLTAPPIWPASIADKADVAMSYQIVTVDTSSISMLVNRVVPQIDVTAVLDKRDEAACEAVVNQLIEIRGQLDAANEIPEVEWSRMRGRALEFQENMRSRDNLAARTAKMACKLCQDFDEHYEILHETRLIETELQQLKMLLSDQNLELLPDYEQRVAVLKELQFIDENSTVLLKGRVACEINSSSELVLTELILENTLSQYTPEEAVALLSIFVFVEKSDSAPEIPVILQEGLRTIYGIAERVEKVQDYNRVQHDDFFTKYKPGLVEVVYEWARGMPFDQITDLTDVPEGTIVRCITRLDETCREVRDAARVIGDKELFTKMEEAQALIKRDIVFAASLYF